ncbi:Gfo/Idh/MocA family protein [Jiangella asiatica]|nr:Gfo/Idh/MocA family oxidoreductase [Jiangella asiatica]
MERVRIGLLGAGFVSDFYLRALRYVRDHEVVAISSRSRDRAEAVARRWGIPVATTSIADVVTRDDVDLVVVGLPHHLHVEAVTAAAQAGKAVLCTKPLGRNADEARECLQAAERAGVWHGYAETELFVPAVRQAKQLVDDGAVGDVYWVRAREAHSAPHAHARDKELMGGGPLRGLGIHGVAIGRWFLGGGVPTEVLAWGDRLARDDVDCEDSAIAMIRFADRRVAQVEVGWGHLAGLDVRTEIHGSNGYIATDHTGQTGIRAFAGESAGYVVEKAGSDRGWVNPVPQEEWSYGYHAELDHFVHAFLAGERPVQTFRDGMIDNAVVDAAYRSMASGGWEAVTV